MMNGVEVVVGEDIEAEEPGEGGVTGVGIGEIGFSQEGR